MQQVTGQGHRNHTSESTDEELTSCLTKWSACSFSNAWGAGLIEMEREEKATCTLLSVSFRISLFFCIAYNSPLLRWKESTAFDFNIALPAFLCWLKFRWSKPASWIKAKGREKEVSSAKNQFIRNKS